MQLVQGVFMNEAYICWRCGAALVELILPMSRREECKACAADQHVCKLCRHYAPNLSDACSEERAEDVNDWRLHEVLVIYSSETEKKSL